MHDITYISDSEDSSEAQNEGGYEPQQNGIVPKIEITSLDLAPQNMGDNRASSSGSNLRSTFIQMGFSHHLVNRVIEEKGEEDADLILDTLFKYSDLENSQSGPSLHNLLTDSKDVITADVLPKKILHRAEPGSSDSLDSLFGDDKDTSCSPVIAGFICPKEELDEVDEVETDKRAALLRMNFSLDQINFAIDKIGEDATVNEIVDFIFAAQIAEKQAEEDANYVNEERNEEATTESLFGTMDKTLRLLEMGFSENQISAAIETYGSEVPVAELADSICRDENAGPSNVKREFDHIVDAFQVKTEEPSPAEPSRYRDVGLEKFKGKRPQEEYDNLRSLKRPKQEYEEHFDAFSGSARSEARRGGSSVLSSSRMPFLGEELDHKAEHTNGFATPRPSNPMMCRTVEQVISKPPYFLYGNVLNISHDDWGKISQFLYGVEPEIVNDQLFSALNRKEGYVHNLPSKNRFRITPKSPLTIEEAVPPHTKKWWPSWDTRTHLSSINTEVSGVSPLCDRLGKTISSCRGVLSQENQREILHQCKTFNLVWIGNHKLAAMDPENLERVLGYRAKHTEALFDRRERLHALKHCFQTDTLGYHLSPLKSLYPGGINMLSIYSGIGGAEVALHRLGIRLKAVVSVEPCEIKRKVLRNWWHNSEQAGELVVKEDILKLKDSELNSLLKRYEGFDLVVCQNPYTYSARNPNSTGEMGDVNSTTFYEFVRVLKHVRNFGGRGR